MKFPVSGPARAWTLRINMEPKFWTGRNVALLVAAVMVGLLFSAQASAQAQPSVGIFDDILAEYVKRAQGWESHLRSIALGLFGGLAVISLAWTFIKLLLNKNDLSAFIPTMAMQIMTLGFFLFLVEKGSWVAGMVISSFEQAGQRVGGTGPLSPSWIVINGFDCVFATFEKVADLQWQDMVSFGLPLCLLGIGVMVCFVVVAILLLVTMVEAYFVMYGGIIMLGFGALPWTRDIPKNYLIYAINVGVKIFVLYLVVSIGVDLSNGWPEAIRAADTKGVIQTVLFLFAGGLIFAAVAWKIPGIAAALTSGSINFNASDALGVGAAAGAVAGGAVAAATGGASAAAGSLAKATSGAMQAASAGTSLAKEQGASGAGAAIRGLGHAASALRTEAGAAVKSKVGMAPPSPHAEDSRGREVRNLGTRAANRLGDQLQAEREGKQSAPGPGGERGAATSPLGPAPESSGLPLEVAATGIEAGAAPARPPEDADALHAAPAISQQGSAAGIALAGAEAAGVAPGLAGSGGTVSVPPRAAAGSVVSGAPSAGPVVSGAPAAGSVVSGAPAAGPLVTGGAAATRLPSQAVGGVASTSPTVRPLNSEDATAASFKEPEVKGVSPGSGFRAPQLPPDAGTGGVQINLNSSDD